MVEGWGGDNDDGMTVMMVMMMMAMLLVFLWLMLLIVFWIAVLISGMISSFSRSYRPRESVLCLSLFGCLGGCLWIIAYVGR